MLSIFYKVCRKCKPHQNYSMCVPYMDIGQVYKWKWIPFGNCLRTMEFLQSPLWLEFGMGSLSRRYR